MHSVGDFVLPNMIPSDEDSEILVEEDYHTCKEQHPQLTKVSHQQKHLSENENNVILTSFPLQFYTS